MSVFQVAWVAAGGPGPSIDGPALLGGRINLGRTAQTTNNPNRRVAALFTSAAVQMDALMNTFSQIAEHYTEEGDELGEDL